MDINKYYVEQGTGSPIVFIYGSYATTSTWKKMVEHLSNNHRCILIKLPGHCGTPDLKDFSNPCVETELSIIEKVVSWLTDLVSSLKCDSHSY
jgi:pimeloyl-ACP methyl ester carboxylesterase